VGFLLHAATIDLERLGTRRTLSLPGLSATVGEEIEALRRVSGNGAARLIRHEPDATIAGIVASWPRDFDASRAEALGFKAESSMDEIIRVLSNTNSVAASTVISASWRTASTS